MKTAPFEKLLKFLGKLNRRKIHFELSQHRAEAIMVEIAIPGERWEVEFFADGALEVERFKSTGQIAGETELLELFRKYSD